MHVLSVDTSTSYVIAGVVECPVGSAVGSAVGSERRPRLLAERVELNPRGHMEVLTPNILASLEEAGITPEDLDAVVVGVGPGPFTGLRVGMATGAAFGDALGIPVHGVPGHCATAATATAATAAVGSFRRLVVSDARRREWYWSLIDGATGAVLDGPAVAAPDDVIAAVPEAEVLASREVAERAGGVTGWTVVDADARPTPVGLVTAAVQLLGGVEGLRHPGAPLRALYLRRPDAVEPKAVQTSAALDFSRVDEVGDSTGEVSAPEDAAGTVQPSVGPLAPQAAARCAEIEAELFHGDSPWPEAGFASEITAPNTVYLGMVTGQGTSQERLVGYAGLAKNGPAGDPEFEIHTIGLEPAVQGRGWSRKLMDPLMDLADRDDGPVYLEVRTDNGPAISLYRSYGFDITGTRRNYYRPSGADAYTMCRPARSRRMSEAPRLIMGIESSCDETGVGVVELHSDGRVRQVSNRVASSMEQHARFGGVVPEIASRAHLESMGPTMAAALDDLERATAATGGRRRPDAVAATVGPGLAGALLVGAAAAKAYAAAWGVPFYGVNHLGGHVAVGTLEVDGDDDAGAVGDLDRAVALLVSGGHTQILQVNGVGRPMVELGSTLDDAAGEAYDKVARLLGLGYPGGPVIDRLAAQGDPAAIAFPRGMSRPGDAAYDFSFSGLKTAVARFVEKAAAEGRTIPVEDVCASFQEAVVDVLTAKAVRACVDTGATVMLLGGGVSANRRLRALAAERCAAVGVRLVVPALPLCTDNGVMIATLAARLIEAGAPASSLDAATDPSMDVEVPVLAPSLVEG
ncbi:multifunctional tRNA (adenosine(37)-N6)-threonylcarbamoyltransferase complex dimerization subunit type 1 TsaB/ribosomal protein alanine acetyltransferase/tRNA (adenosine(37)-N6)-threonylcarbamoyltransferase complex transferase subunit TsaD [Corynebacterium sp. CNJ-954]|uniref:tRNA (adenosine(37)-N6)-threonylcarbamoyltransferase complex transferase subunit TsaD n=1 Tax=Corynebacterium sp. CNJ-954 TaxID=1904962 RepID=UPI00095E3EB6|nr:tRNA (adenosine(37)-N6)-threonylcarbamoyltransferase complex transferase subunit TsaD [Corynebacterium sp. CNJ-954]OLT56178.1 multifunctional tRNA (adenosine(37)-N6)-threonylcarbamoyltransferase complex dimerization subunit type 1 TsaB/ribosomal protein alanine acetyltransferase/tRNA (adenosine(37)-N6)-threonylcarbamoyltransferase complex transferase subunit TsaD [Corynebacterium sp. CNJ-954]